MTCAVSRLNGFGVAVLLAMSAVVSTAHAQYPTKPVRMIIPFPPGGGTDAIGRIVSQKLSDVFKQQVIMDNRPGAGANIGVELAARSAPDGYTLLLATISNAISAGLYAKLNYDLIRDFSPVTLLATQPLLLTVHPSLPVKSVRELILFAKHAPNQLTYSSAGNGTPTHLAGELFRQSAQISLTHVPYKGGGPSVIALISGEVPLSIASLPSVLVYVRANKLRGLAVSSGKRSPSAPEFPTLSEAGVAGYDVTAWYGLLAPAGTPGPIIARLNTEVALLLKAPDARQLLDRLGFEITVNSPKEFSAFISEDIQKWMRIVKASGTRVE